MIQLFLFFLSEQAEVDLYNQGSEAPLPGDFILSTPEVVSIPKTMTTQDVCFSVSQGVKVESGFGQQNNVKYQDQDNDLYSGFNIISNQTLQTY